jgi:Family of unknown function (DUF5695)
MIVVLVSASLFVALPVAARAQSAGEPISSVATSQFTANFDAGAIVSLRSSRDRNHTEFVQSGRRLGDVVLRYRQTGKPWQLIDTANLVRSIAGILSRTSDEAEYRAVYQVADRAAAILDLEVRFVFQERAIHWTLMVRNRTSQPLEIGDLGLPLPMNRSLGESGGAMLKHSFVSGHGSFLFWMRSDSDAPYLVLTPSDNTSLEYWEAQRGGPRGFAVYIHSAAAAEAAEDHGASWRQPHTRLMLSPRGMAGDAQSYGFKFHWVDDYNAVRQLLVDEGQIDVQVVPGMTIPTDLSAQFALRTKQPIAGIDAEFPDSTKIEVVGQKGDIHIYKARFSKLGENRLAVRYGGGKHMFLEFFCTEPLETLIKKRAAFLAHSQHRNPSKWYNGLITDWNMETHTLLSPDHYDPIPQSRVYAVTCDDPGLGKPAFLAAKNAEFPVQSEVEALDYYIDHFVWGGLQRTTNETYSFGIYGTPDWRTNRQSIDPGRRGQLHLWRIYDYPHVVVMYFGMYRVAKNHPEIKTALGAKEYLQRAYGTATAMYTVPHEIWSNWSPFGTGFYNEVVIVDLIDALQSAGMTAEADRLRGCWERKVRSFVNGRQDLFRSEYAFDSTGFESTHALAKYAMQHVDTPGAETNIGVTLPQAKQFMETQMTANIFCRGWLEPAYYYLGSDYRGGGGNAYTLTYMSQIGGWAVLDYALNYARDPSPYLRLGYASYLSAWALMNTGTPESNYGYWYPGQANDGGAGGGFEPAAYGRTWLGQPHHRGSWYFSSEIDLGYCGALRTAATVLADDTIFGWFCFGGEWRKASAGFEIIPKDGLRRRIHALLAAGKLHLTLDNDRFAAGQPIVFAEDLSRIQFTLESDNPAAHVATLRILGLKASDYNLTHTNQLIATLRVTDGPESVAELPMESKNGSDPFIIARCK